MARALALALAALLAAAPARGGWVVDWEDDFSGPSLNTSLWNVATNASEGSNQIELYTADNVFLAGGALVLRTRPATVTAGGRTYNVTSGRVDTSGRGNVTAPFRVEVSARLQDDARASGLHTAHWLLGYACWPAGGEIDIMEMQSPGNEYSACNRSKWAQATSNYHIGAAGQCGVETRHSTGTSAWPRAPTPGVDFARYYTRFWAELNATDLLVGVNDTVVNHVYAGMPGWAGQWTLPTWPMYLLLTQAYMARRPCGDPAPGDWPVLQHFDYVRTWRWEA